LIKAHPASRRAAREGYTADDSVGAGVEKSVSQNKKVHLQRKYCAGGTKWDRRKAQKLTWKGRCRKGTKKKAEPRGTAKKNRSDSIRQKKTLKKTGFLKENDEEDNA